ncbi:MAG: flagellar basal body protein FliL [Comamonas sp. SCN 67-35]|uniref:flagellar basal body-associated FliL family protein n=1 Tax=unclassified Comamonas TaxID=2638500 RepID=UPI00086A5B84|nr:MULTISPECIES: flagellar basal body-associated FliL family protein [unclassified Comamonas]MBN9329881.1 flagellar basal body-associated FliL family protein [Comamonas sp.]ODU40110.1 MAG: flagellar basal body protein FliL [Comamonas sp. SCN 67-35]OJW97122.1 MAG: flagellar basal body protein FliL [Burkholderiales bacterium 66-26]
MAEETAAPAPAPVKGKKKWLVIIIALVVVLAIAAAGVLWFLAKQRSASLEGEGGDESAAQIEEPKTPPTFLPMDNMVVNLADPGGERFAQVGITFELSDGKTAEKVKSLMPTIRSRVLLLLSQRSADDLLSREGKEKLAADIRGEALGALGYVSPKVKTAKPRAADGEEAAKPRKPEVDRDAPVRAVLFSSFIVQ